MSGEWIDRLDAEMLSETLGLPVNAVDENAEVFTRGLWDMMLSFVPMPESVDERWNYLAAALMGWEL